MASIVRTVDGRSLFLSEDRRTVRDRLKNPTPAEFMFYRSAGDPARYVVIYPEHVVSVEDE